tara:strand:- start:127 stop:237 length:111 start_codon:yes stop_codon:yes gene_type:complete
MCISLVKEIMNVKRLKLFQKIRAILLKIIQKGNRAK